MDEAITEDQEPPPDMEEPPTSNKDSMGLPIVATSILPNSSVAGRPPLSRGLFRCWRAIHPIGSPWCSGYLAVYGDIRE